MSDGEDIATPKTFGDYPLELLRFMKEKEHAEQFLAGSIRFSSLDYYKCVEDPKRQDSREGTGLITTPDYPGGIHASTTPVSLLQNS